jgi:hypothetical protein
VGKDSEPVVPSVLALEGYEMVVPFVALPEVVVNVVALSPFGLTKGLSRPMPQ